MVALTQFGVQPVIATVGEGAGVQTYRVGALGDETETVSLAVSCTNDLSIDGNMNLIHWQGDGSSYRVYKAADGVFGLIGETADSFLIDFNLAPDTGQPPPGA